MNYYQIFELVCRACGETITKRLSQFDELPSCKKCGSQTVVENVTTVKEKDNGKI